MFSQSSGMSRLRRREIEFDKILESLNKREFLRKGVRWNVGENGAWISLDLNFALSRRRANGAPPDNNPFPVRAVL